MKYRLITALFAFFMVLTSCYSNNYSESKNCIQVKMVQSLCGQAILQVVYPESTQLELQSWIDGDGVTYDNVFSTVMPCDVGQSTGEVGSQFYIEIIEAPEIGECIRCLAILANAPELSYSIKMVDSCD